MQPIQSGWPKIGLKEVSSPQPVKTVPAYTASLAPSNLARSPMLWTSQEVKAWLGFCVEEFALSPVCMHKFDMNGKALCLLLRNDFMERAPHAGDVLFNAFQQLKAQDTAFPSYQSIGIPVYSANSSTMTIVTPPCQIPTTASDTSGPLKSPAANQSHPCFVPILPQPSVNSNNNINNNNSNSSNNSIDEAHTNGGVSIGLREELTTAGIPASMLSPAPTEKYSSDSDSCNNESGQSPHSIDQNIDSNDSAPGPENELGMGLNLSQMSVNEGECRLLWEFIHQLLEDEKYSELVCWDKDSQEELTFRINKPMELADLWGRQKNRSNMTYEKLSRALRYYYKMNIIRKVQGKRLTYQFLQHPTKIRKGQRGARPHALKMMMNAGQSSSLITSCETLMTTSNTSTHLGLSGTTVCQTGMMVSSLTKEALQSHFGEEMRLDTKDRYNSIGAMLCDNVGKGPGSAYGALPAHLDKKPFVDSEHETMISYEEYRRDSCDSLRKSESPNDAQIKLMPLGGERTHHSRVDLDSERSRWVRDRSPTTVQNNHGINPSPVEATPYSRFYSTAHLGRSRSPTRGVKSSPTCDTEYTPYSSDPTIHPAHSSSSSDPINRSGYSHNNSIALPAHPVTRQHALPLLQHPPSPLYSSNHRLQNLCDNPADHESNTVEKQTYHKLPRERYYRNYPVSSEPYTKMEYTEQDKPEDLSIKKCPTKNKNEAS